MPKCVFKDCKNSVRSFKKDGASYFRFPRDPFRCAEWTSVVAQQRCQEHFTPTNTSVVCSEHFSKSDICEGDEGIELSDTAVPSIDLPKEVLLMEVTPAPNAAYYAGRVEPSGSRRNSASTSRDMSTDVTHTSDTFRAMDVGGTSYQGDDSDEDDVMEVVDAPETVNMEVTATGPATTKVPVATKLAKTMHAVAGKSTKNFVYKPVPPKVNTNEIVFFKEPARPGEVIGTKTIRINRLVAAKYLTTAYNLPHNEMLRVRVLDCRKREIERNDVITSLTNRNLRLNKRVAFLKKQLKEARKTIAEQTFFSKNLCKTLFFKYVRDFDHLYCQTYDPECSDDEPE